MILATRTIGDTNATLQVEQLTANQFALTLCDGAYKLNLWQGVYLWQAMSRLNALQRLHVTQAH